VIPGFDDVEVVHENYCTTFLNFDSCMA